MKAAFKSTVIDVVLSGIIIRFSGARFSIIIYRGHVEDGESSL